VQLAVIIQARMGSRRLPGKVLRPICGKPLLRYLLDRLDRCESIGEYVVATSTQAMDDPIAAYFSLYGVACSRGSESDVATRFLQTADEFGFASKKMARCCRPGGKLLIHFTSKENAEFGKKYGSQDCRFADSPDLNKRDVAPSSYYAAADVREIRKICKRLQLELRDRVPNSFFLDNRIIGYRPIHALSQRGARMASRREGSRLCDLV